MWDLIVSVPDHCLSFYFCFGLFYLSLFVRFLFIFDLLFNLFRIALWPSVGKELSPCFFYLCCFYFSAVLIVGVPFPFGV